MIRVLYIDYSPIIGGTAKVLLNLLKRVERDKVYPVVIVPRDSKILQAYTATGVEVKATGMPLLTVRTNFLGFISYIYYLILFTFNTLNLAREKGVDIIHANGFISALYGLPCALISRQPLIWHMHDILALNLFNKLFIRLAGFGASRIVCVSEAVIKRLIEFGVDKKKCTVIYNSVPASVKDDSSFGEKFRKEFGINKKTLLVGMIGQITPLKGQIFLIRAIPEIIKHFSDTKFIFVGDTMVGQDHKYGEELHKIVNGSDLKDKVIFTGFREDVLEIMSILDIVAVASILPDSLPNVVLEAMALGRPVVASDIGGIPEMVTDGVNGFLLPPGKPEMLSQAICKLLRNSDLRQQLGKAGIEIARDKFSERENLNKVMTVYRDLAPS